MDAKYMGGKGAEKEEKKQGESTRDELRTESLSGLDHCSRSLARWLQHILGSQEACGWETGWKVTTPG